MPRSDMNEKTNLPHRVSLGEVLGAIEMSPGEVAAFLSHMASIFRDSAHPNLARNFTDHAALVANPETYGYKPPEQPQQTEERPYESPSPQSVRYGNQTAQTNVPNVPPQQSAQAAQGAATTPGTLGTSNASPSQEQYATERQGAAPPPSPTPPTAPDNFESAPVAVP